MEPSTCSGSADAEQQRAAAAAGSKEPPVSHAALPAPDSSDTVSLPVTGEAVSLVDSLGPTVVNTDGTVSRIANWSALSEAEKERTLLVLGRRNRARLEALRGHGDSAGSRPVN